MRPRIIGTGRPILCEKTAMDEHNSPRWSSDIATGGANSPGGFAKRSIDGRDVDMPPTN